MKCKKLMSLVLAFTLVCGVSGCVQGPAEEKETQELTAASRSTAINALAGTDALGRTIEGASALRDDKYVGIMYFLTHGQSYNQQKDIYVAPDLLEELGAEEFWKHSRRSPTPQFHYWGEPIWGFFGTDEWVIRKDIIMLTLADVDFLLFDVTNGPTFDMNWQLVAKVAQEYYDEGWDVPKLVFYTNTDSARTMEHLYNVLYSKGEYRDLWFSPNGKPMIVGDPTGLSQEIRDFFEFKANQWPGQPMKDNAMPWMDFNRPQTVYRSSTDPEYSAIAVSPAQGRGDGQHAYPFSDARQFYALRDNIAGRGYTTENPHNGDEQAVLEGANFQEHWQTVFDEDPQYVIIVGWNEWSAQKFMDGGATQIDGIPSERVYFWDLFDPELSRDIQPHNGILGDNFYMQMVQNIRRFKSTGAEKIRYDSQAFSLTDDLTQWENSDVAAFACFSKSAEARNEWNAARTEKYEQDAARNDITQMRVAHSEENLYILIEGREELTGRNAGDTSYMNVYLSVNGMQGDNYSGFHYVIGRNAGQDGVSVERLGGQTPQSCGSAKELAFGRYHIYEIPLSALNISDDFIIAVKATDEILSSEDILNFYRTGECEPIGRFAYEYAGNL